MKDLGNVANGFVGKLYVKDNVLKPLLWLFVPCAVFALAGAYFLPQYTFLLLCVPMSVVFVTLAMYIYFAVKDPLRLQSE